MAVLFTPDVLLSSQQAPTTTVSLDEEKAKDVLELVDRFEQDDAVQRVFHNLV
jgi:transcriptional/translational regulatory protein YebC/TACO1